MLSPPCEARSDVRSEPPSLRRNYWAHCIEGSLFIGALAFVNPHTVLPRMCQALGAPSWLIALAPSLLMIGFIVPGLFVARHIEALPAMRPFLMRVTLWQRMPYLAVGVGLLSVVVSPAGALALIVLAPLASGLCGGVAVNAWKEYVTSTIPESQRASLWATRFAIGTVIGLVAGKLVGVTLERYPGVAGYGVLHLIAFAILLASYLVFSFSSEGTRVVLRPSSKTLRDSIAELPLLLRANPGVRAYAITRYTFHGFLIMAPFLGIHALDVLHKPDSYLGELLVAHTAGSLAGFLLGGYSGDRHGSKASMVTAQVGFLVLCAAAPFAATEREFLGLFVLFGFALSLGTVAATTLDLEIAPRERRPTFQALLGMFALAGVLTSSLVSSAIRTLTSSFGALCLPTAALMLASLVVTLSLEDPRRRSLALP